MERGWQQAHMALQCEWIPLCKKIIIIRTFIKRHKSRNIHSEALYMSMYTCVVEL